MEHSKEAERAGFTGASAGTDLFKKIVSSPSGTITNISSYEESFDRIPHPRDKFVGTPLHKFVPARVSLITP